MDIPPKMFDIKQINQRKQNIYNNMKSVKEENENQKLLKKRAEKEMKIIKPTLEIKRKQYDEPLINPNLIAEEFKEFIKNCEK
jgi:hypothetical protein|tara:strand:+ start:503 stop:751 length:249 start_codon:yes stop_codon:yes gene_type:complete